MKFADKLFLAMTVLLALIFTIFGIWMLSSYFQKQLNRELEQAGTENQMFQYLYEMAYQSVAEYGERYAINRAIDSVVESVEKEGNRCFVINEQGEYLYGEGMERIENLHLAARRLIEQLGDGQSYAYSIQEQEHSYTLLNVCISEIGEQNIYLGINRDLTEIYEDREALLNQYRVALVVLVLIGSGCVYIMSRYITRPIRDLKMVAGRIAGGDYEKRSNYLAEDEIGDLAGSFNRMADKLVDEMHRKELEAKQQEDFTAAFAHELKTPLTSIIGYADMLNSIQLSEEERREAYYYIYNQGKRLESLSHKLLELVSVERHTHTFRPISAKQLEENLRNTMRPIFRQKNIKGKITMEKGNIYGDYELLLSLLYNVLDNGVKAVDEGGFLLLKGIALNTGYEIKIVDNGRGIPAEEISRITEAFYMVDKSRSRKEGGAGIGMALSQKIMRLHKGTMRIESKLGEGTVIKLTFPGGGNG